MWLLSGGCCNRNRGCDRHNEIRKHRLCPWASRSLLSEKHRFSGATATLLVVKNAGFFHSNHWVFGQKPFLTSKFQKHLNWMSVCSTKHGPKPVAFCWQFVAECSANPETMASVGFFCSIYSIWTRADVKPLFNIFTQCFYHDQFHQFLLSPLAHLVFWILGQGIYMWLCFLAKDGKVSDLKTNALPDPKKEHYFTQLFSRNGEVMQAETIVKQNQSG